MAHYTILHEGYTHPDDGIAAPPVTIESAPYYSDAIHPDRNRMLAKFERWGAKNPRVVDVPQNLVAKRFAKFTR